MYTMNMYFQKNMYITGPHNIASGVGASSIDPFLPPSQRRTLIADLQIKFSVPHLEIVATTSRILS